MDVSPLVTAVVWVGAGLLVLAGGTKLRTPDAAMAALHSLRLPSGRGAARLLGLGEIAVGGVLLAIGGTGAAAVSAATYLALTAVAVRQRSRQIDCGCFGVRRYPVSRLHVATNAVIALISAVGLGAAAPWSVDTLIADAGLVAAGAAAVLVATGVGLLTTMLEQAGMAEAPRVRARTATVGA